MGRGKVVSAPDGAHWLVKRRWVDRRLADLRKRFRSGRDERREDAFVEGLFFAPDLTDGGWISIGLAVAVLLILFVLLPLLGVALELIALIFLLFSGLAGRLFLGRPWIVEAVSQGESGRSVRFPVKGWRRAGQAAADLARVIEATGSPEHFEVAGLS